MADEMMLPPDKGTPYRSMVERWDDLWHGRYMYATKQRAATVDAAPGYSRSFARLVAGLFERQPPEFVGTGPFDELELSELLGEVASKGAGYGQVLIRPVSDGQRWQPSVLAPTRYHVDWAHRRPSRVIVWDYAADPRTDDDKRGLAIVETWQPGGDTAGTVTTQVFETERALSGDGWRTMREIDVSNPPDALADHPFVVSAGNDAVPRDLFVFVWAWETVGPVSLWYTNENVLDGLARLWDQEQDDAEMTRRRVAMPEEALGRKKVLADGDTTVLARPGFNKHDNILLLQSSMSAEFGPTGGVTPIEFDDDLIQRERIERRENALLEAVGINPASIGRNVGGRSDSAAAKRADNQMTMNTITQPARRLERVLSAVAVEIGRLTPGSGSGAVEVSVHEGLKENPAESAEVARLLRDAEAASTTTLVRTAHPTWTVEQVDAEVEAMQAEGAAAAPLEF